MTTTWCQGREYRLTRKLEKTILKEIKERQVTRALNFVNNSLCIWVYVQDELEDEQYLQEFLDNEEEDETGGDITHTNLEDWHLVFEVSP